MAMQLATRRAALAVGIIILAVTTVAVISVVKQRGEAARHAEVTKIADEKVKQLESDSAAKKSQDEKKNEADKKAATDAEKEAAAEKSRGVDSQSQQAISSELPQTGPANYLAAIPLGLVTFAAVSYIGSRRV